MTDKELKKIELIGQAEAIYKAMSNRAWDIKMSAEKLTADSCALFVKNSSFIVEKLEEVQILYERWRKISAELEISARKK